MAAGKLKDGFKNRSFVALDRDAFGQAFFRFFYIAKICYIKTFLRKDQQPGFAAGKTGQIADISIVTDQISVKLVGF